MHYHPGGRGLKTSWKAPVTSFADLEMPTSRYVVPKEGFVLVRAGDGTDSGEALLAAGPAATRWAPPVERTGLFLDLTALPVSSRSLLGLANELGPLSRWQFEWGNRAACSVLAARCELEYLKLAGLAFRARVSDLPASALQRLAREARALDEKYMRETRIDTEARAPAVPAGLPGRETVWHWLAEIVGLWLDGSWPPPGAGDGDGIARPVPAVAERLYFDGMTFRRSEIVEGVFALAWRQLACALETEIEFRRCERCSHWFALGSIAPGSAFKGRRRGTRYCGKKCRDAASYWSRKRRLRPGG